MPFRPFRRPTGAGTSSPPAEGPAGSQGSGRRLPRSANDVLGFLLLPALALSIATGVAIWWLGLTNPPAAMPVIFAHGYVGFFSLPLVVAKLVAGLTSWRRTPAPTWSVATVMTAGLVVTTVLLYGSGALMFANVTPGGNAAYKQVHLWATITAAPFVTFHLVEYAARAVRLGRRRLARQPPGASLSRAAFLRLSALGILAIWAVGRVSTRLGGEIRDSDPNDFPVTLSGGGADRPDPATWWLEVGGHVERPFRVSLEELGRLPRVRETYSLDCIIGWSVTREWGGVAVMELIDAAQPVGEVLSARFVSTTGYESILPLAVLQRPGTMVAWEVDGVALTGEHGYPGRLMAPGVIGEECVKWLARIDVISAS